MTLKELNDEFEKASSNLFKTKFEVGTGSSKANHEIGKLKKYRAQIKTVQRQFQMEETAKFETQKEVDVKEEAKEEEKAK